MSDFNDDNDFDDLVEEAIGNKPIENPDDVVGLCTECKTVIEPQFLENDIFAQMGAQPVCRYCKGTVIIILREVINDQLKRQLDAKRGL